MPVSKLRRYNNSGGYGFILATTVLTRSCISADYPKPALNGRALECACIRSRDKRRRESSSHADHFTERVIFAVRGQPPRRSLELRASKTGAIPKSAHFRFKS